MTEAEVAKEIIEFCIETGELEFEIKSIHHSCNEIELSIKDSDDRFTYYNKKGGLGEYNIEQLKEEYKKFTNNL